MSKGETAAYFRVRDQYQVHLWDHAGRDSGVLVDTGTGVDRSLGHAIATALRLMNGIRSIQAIATAFADAMGMTCADAETAVREIALQFSAEDVVESASRSFAERDFSPSLTLPYQLKIMQLQLTNRCNLTCPHCYADSGKALPNELDLDSFLTLINEFSDLGGERLFLTGGETLLFANLERLIRHAKTRHLFVYLSTNGLALKERIIDRLIEWGVGAVNISIDGANAATHDAFRGRAGAYQQAIRAIDHLHDRGILCATQTTLFKGNLDESIAIADGMRDRGVRDCFFVRMMPQGRGQENRALIPTLEEYSQAREEEYRNRRLKHGMNVYPKKVLHKSTSFRCSAAISQLYVTADGRCYPCPPLETSELHFGTYPERSLRDIWANGGKEVEELRQFKPKNLSECVDCRHQPFCKGGCAGNALRVTGDWRRADPHFCILMDIRERVQRLEPLSNHGGTASSQALP